MPVMTPPTTEPLLAIKYPVFGNSIDYQIFDVLYSMHFSRRFPEWPTPPSILRESVKYILQRICDMNVPYPLDNRQKLRVQQLVRRADEYCRQMRLLPLPVSWFDPVSA